MIAVSSFRPLNRTEEYRENQIRAHRNWETIFDAIWYLNDYEPELAGKTTLFFAGDQWPRMRDVAKLAASAKKAATVINADIVLDPKIKDVFAVVTDKEVGAATSRRFDLETRTLDPNDRGRDIFICKQRIWSQVAREMPESCRFGHQQWDSWMIGFLRRTLGTRFVEFTQMACVFHPKHEGREMPYAAEVNIDGPYKGYWNGTQDTQLL